MIEINVLSWYTETISTEKTGNRHVSRRKVVQMTEHNATSLSASLVNRKVYTVCYTGLDTLSSFHDALYEARRSYFGSGKTVHIRARGIFDGLSGEVHGKLSRRTIKWKKRAGKNTLEAAFTNGGQRGIAFYNAYGALRARVYYDGEMQWMRTEYFSPDDDRRARITFKPDDHRDAVIRFDYNDSTGKPCCSPCRMRSKPPSRVCKTPSSATAFCSSPMSAANTPTARVKSSSAASNF